MKIIKTHHLSSFDLGVPPPPSQISLSSFPLSCRSLSLLILWWVLTCWELICVEERRVVVAQEVVAAEECRRWRWWWQRRWWRRRSVGGGGGCGRGGGGRGRRGRRGEEVGRGWKMMEHVCLVKRSRRPFLMKGLRENKQSAASKRLPASARRRHKWPEVLLAKKQTEP
ncbi:hypothetical protein Hanom_Chr07g00633691 [Helianthus anomalus]